jgi:hypothetical protein
VSGGRRTGLRDCEAVPHTGGVEPVDDNAPSADRIVCRGRAGEQVAPPRASVWVVVSRRSGNSGPPRWAARLQARVGSGSASPPPLEPTNLASARSLVPVWPGGPCGCWPTCRCCQAWPALGGAIGPNFRGTLGRCRTRRRAATPGEDHWCVQGLVLWWRLATYRLRRSCTALPGGRLTGPRAREAAPHVWRRRAPLRAGPGRPPAGARRRSPQHLHLKEQPCQSPAPTRAIVVIA